jgi:hypothetical protein
MAATVYYEDGRIERIMPKNGKNFKLKELQSIVNGMVQIVPLNGKLMVCNEEGKINGECEPNIMATVEWIKVYGTTDVIFGNALICDESMIE